MMFLFPLMFLAYSNGYQRHINIHRNLGMIAETMKPVYHEASFWRLHLISKVPCLDNDLGVP